MTQVMRQLAPVLPAAGTVVVPEGAQVRPGRGGLQAPRAGEPVHRRQALPAPRAQRQVSLAVDRFGWAQARDMGARVHRDAQVDVGGAEVVVGQAVAGQQISSLRGGAVAGPDSVTAQPVAAAWAVGGRDRRQPPVWMSCTRGLLAQDVLMPRAGAVWHAVSASG
ncbi:hypothetical protein GCM10025331_72240 [Actinoplanes utahensis]|nr:hypothetical protein Aut01nite_68670 [Actinoplanes utahensis]